MRWGFAWDAGPFETWDAYGVANGVKRMKELKHRGAPPGSRPCSSSRPHQSFFGEEGPTILSGTRRSRSQRAGAENRPADHRRWPQTQQQEARRERLGDAVGHGRRRAAGRVPLQDELHRHRQYRAVAPRDRPRRQGRLARPSSSATTASNFSAGANIAMLLWACKEGQWDDVKKLVREFQRANQRLRYCGVPVVTAPHGYTLRRRLRGHDGVATPSRPRLRRTLAWLSSASGSFPVAAATCS
jgi:3-hydroxyacyl-CoA dehydrogenase